MSEMTRDYLQAVAGLQDSGFGRAAFATLDRIDAKTGALLTHVSIMMAILIVTSARLSPNPFVHAAIRLEILSYLIVTLISLQAIAMARSPGDLDRHLTRVGRRLQAYRLSLATTVATTGAFVVTLGVESLLR